MGTISNKKSKKLDKFWLSLQIICSYVSQGQETNQVVLPQV